MGELRCRAGTRRTTLREWAPTTTGPWARWSVQAEQRKRGRLSLGRPGRQGRFREWSEKQGTTCWPDRLSMYWSHQNAERHAASGNAGSEADGLWSQRVARAFARIIRGGPPSVGYRHRRRCGRRGSTAGGHWAQEPRRSPVATKRPAGDDAERGRGDDFVADGRPDRRAPAAVLVMRSQEARPAASHRSGVPPGCSVATELERP